MKNHNAAKLNLLRKLLLTGTGLAAVAIPLGLGVFRDALRRKTFRDPYSMQPRLSDRLRVLVAKDPALEPEGLQRLI